MFVGGLPLTVTENKIHECFCFVRFATKEATEKAVKEKNGIALDFDSACPPEQAWRRKLDSHASKLKEFSVTFFEALRTMRLGIRLWSYVKEEASRWKAPIDPFTRESFRPSASQGVPLGGIGSGSISRGFRGEFRHFQLIPGACEASPIMENQFSVNI